MWDIRTWDYEEDAKRCYNEGAANTRIVYFPADDEKPPVAMTEEMRKVLPEILVAAEESLGTCSNHGPAGDVSCPHAFCILRSQMAAAGIEVK